MIPQNFLKTIATEHHVSNAELEVLSLALEGESTAGIAQKIGISGDAVRKRLSEVYQKFEIGGRGPVKLTKLQQLLIKQYQEQEVANGNQNGSPQGGIDWDGAPDVSVFYGRNEELVTLKNWILQQGCRLIALQGMGGIGKTALSVKLGYEIQAQFDYLVWRSLYQAPAIEELLTSLIQSLSVGKEIPRLETVNQQISWLISRFRSERCLIILDGFESILSRGELVGVYRRGYEGYGNLLKRLGEEVSKSCLLLTSREKINEVSLLQGENSRVRSLKLEGLGEDARLLLKDKGLSGENNWGHLIQGYRGNPLMLKLAAITIQEVFDGNVTDFLSTTLFTHEVTDFVEESLERLSELEKKIVLLMAKQQEPLSIQQLREILREVGFQDLIRAVGSLRQRSLVEKSSSGFALPPVVMETMTQLAVSPQL